MDQSDAVSEGSNRPQALALLNTVLAREGYEAFYAADWPLSFIGAQYPPTKNLKPNRERMQFIKDGEEIIPGVHAMLAPGHTVGHTIS
jgi:glyoxylase-like metal-dependent hydrolase (beta-lactamase superfamily II)